MRRSVLLSDSLDGTLKRRSVATKKSAEHGVWYPWVVCDECRAAVHGIRYKCQECFDFNLCSRCEARNVHWEHELDAIQFPDLYPALNGEYDYDYLIPC